MACTSDRKGNISTWGKTDNLVGFFIKKIQDDIIEGKVACSGGIKWDNKVVKCGGETS